MADQTVIASSEWIWHDAHKRYFKIYTDGNDQRQVAWYNPYAQQSATAVPLAGQHASGSIHAAFDDDDDDDDDEEEEEEKGEEEDSSGEDDGNAEKLVSGQIHVLSSGKRYPAHMRLDTGADYNFVKIKSLEKWGLNRKVSPARRSFSIRLGDNTTSKKRVYGTINLDLCSHGSFNKTKPPSRFIVLDDLSYDIVLGAKEVIEKGYLKVKRPLQFGALTSTLSPEKKKELSRLQRDARERTEREKWEEAQIVAAGLNINLGFQFSYNAQGGSSSSAGIPTGNPVPDLPPINMGPVDNHGNAGQVGNGNSNSGNMYFGNPPSS